MKDRWLWVRKARAMVRSWLERPWLVLALGLILAVIVIGLPIWFWLAPWDWMKGAWDWMKKGAEESNGAVLRNLALVVAAGIGLVLAGWRSCVAHMQANSQSKQASLQSKQASLQSEQTSLLSKQADTAERGHNNERYQKGADMLGSDVMTTRMGGVYALERVAQEHPHEYHVQIMKLLCAFLRHRAKNSGEEAEAESKELRLDLNAAAQAIGECRRRLAEVFFLENIEGGFSPDLRDTNLSRANLLWADFTGADLKDANLSGANLESANLFCANLSDANLSDANLFSANLSDANLSDANISGANLEKAHLSGANLSGANFHQARGLSQAQLDKARQHPDGPLPKSFPDDLTWDEEAAKERWDDLLVL